MFKLFKYFKRKALLILAGAIFLILLSTLFHIVQPTFVGWTIQIVKAINTKTGEPIIIDSLIKIVIPYEKAWFAYWMVLLTMFCFTLLSFGFGVIGYFISAKASLICTYNLRNCVYGKILTYSFQELNTVTPASLITRLTNDAQKVQQALQMEFSMLIQAPITLIGTGSLIFTASKNMAINAYFGSISLGIMALIILLTILIARIIVPLYGHTQRSIDETSSIIRENVLGVRVVRSFNLQENQREKMSFANNKLKKLSIQVEIWIAAITVVIEFVIFAGISIVYLLSGYLIDSGSFDLSLDLVYKISTTMLIQLSSFIMFVIAIATVIRSKSSAERISSLMEITPSIVNPKRPSKFNTKRYDIEFKNVSYKYTKDSQTEIVKNINLKIKSGETIGIIGPTGSGKSTLVNLIPRLYDPTHGTVYIGGLNIKDIDLHELREYIGISLQDQILFSGDIAYNLRYGKKDATEEEMKKACELSCAWEFISKYDKLFASPVEQRGKNFSGGQRQRVCLARTLIRKPKILILDDTTSALDAITEKKVQKNINNYLPDSTKIIVSQRVSSIMNADRIIVLEQGKICGIGTHNELLMSNNVYKQIAKLQLESLQEAYD